MDRQIVYAGSIPLDTDILSIQRNVQVAIGALAHAILGDTPIVDGMGCLPGSAAYTVSVQPGSLTILTSNDFTAFGALSADTSPVVRSALLPASTALPVTAPADAGHVICSLVQAQFVEVDGTPVALPYWNASNPSVPYSGPGNSGLPQATQRLFRVVLSAKANVPQFSPVGMPPEPDTGWFGLYSVTTFFNKPGIEAADIVPFHSAPRLRYTLPALPPGVTQQAVFSGSASWTAPVGVRWARVRLAGGVGGGGGGDNGYS